MQLRAVRTGLDSGRAILRQSILRLPLLTHPTRGDLFLRTPTLCLQLPDSGSSGHIEDKCGSPCLGKGPLILSCHTCCAARWSGRQCRRHIDLLFFDHRPRSNSKCWLTSQASRKRIQRSAGTTSSEQLWSMSVSHALSVATGNLLHAMKPPCV